MFQVCRLYGWQTKMNTLLGQRQVVEVRVVSELLCVLVGVSLLLSTILSNLVFN